MTSRMGGVEIETLLPLGKVDPGLRAPEVGLDLASVSGDARFVESLGYDGLVIEETKDDPFVVLALAAHATTTLRLGTAVAIAFARSPTVSAMNAWTLQRLSAGRFVLGLGPQVRAHIERRFGMPASPAGPWMRDYVAAVRAVWDCWQHGTPLDHDGSHYRLSLMVPLFDPGPIEHPHIPIHLAAVNPAMCRVAGEVADGIRPHPVCTPSYISDVMLPAVRDGARSAGRSLDRFTVAMKPLAALVDDEVLEQFVVTGTYDEIGAKLLARYGDVVTSVELSIPVRSDQERDALAAIVDEVRHHDTSEATTALQQGLG